MTTNPNLQTLLQQGHNQLDRGNYQAAFETFQQAATLEPQNLEVLYGLGLTCYRLDRYQEAVDYLNQALTIQPNYILALVRRGMAYEEMKETQLSQADYEEAIALTPQNADDWRGRGIALDELKRYEEALAAYNQAIALNPNDYNAWHNKGNMLDELKRYEEALAAYNQAIALNPDDNSAWHNKGITLNNLKRYEEALAAYNQAIALNPDDNSAWNGKGSALTNLGKYEEAIASFNEAVRLTNNQFWMAWANLGIAVLKSQGYKAAVKVWDDGIKALKPEKPDYAEGYGRLHYRKGEILYEYGKQQPNPFPDWFAAKESYEKALEFLTFEHFPQIHIEILQELLQVCSALGDVQTFRRKQEEATQRLEELVSKCQRKGDEITLRRKFATFEQFMVDFRLKSANKQQHIQALELAEERKNICLSWLRENSDYQPKRFVYRDMQRLLNLQTAAVYWHISPVAITTFIIKHNQQPIVLRPNIPEELQAQNYPPYLYQLQRFNDWLEEWKQDYTDYCQGNYSSVEKASAPWRDRMEYRLLNQLRNILEINRIRDLLRDVTNLILIPHKELHSLPLDYLFPPKFNITYLPSFKIGVQLLTQPPSNQVRSLVNIASNDLPFNIIESVVLSSLFPESQQLQINSIQQQSLITAGSTAPLMVN